MKLLVITLLNAVEHFVRPEENLREMISALAPGGKVYVTASKFHRMLRTCGVRHESITYRTVKDLPIVGRIPFLREFFVNQVDAVLVPAE